MASLTEFKLPRISPLFLSNYFLITYSVPLNKLIH